MFILQVLGSQMHFLANRNAKLAILLLFWPVNCIKIGGHVALLSIPYIYRGFAPDWKVCKMRTDGHSFEKKCAPTHLLFHT